MIDGRRIDAIAQQVRRDLGLGARFDQQLKWWVTLVLATGDAAKKIDAAGAAPTPDAPQLPPAKVLRRPVRANDVRELGPAWKTNREA